MSTVALDYLVVGHVTKDLVEDGFLIGGTASYSPRTGRALGYRVAVITSVGPDLDLMVALDGVLIACAPAAKTTTFKNTYADGIATRVQRVYGLAELLTPDMVPTAWEPSVVHLGPVVRECAPELVDSFGDAFIGLTPQGWMRQWDEDGRVSPCEWAHPDRMLARADAVVLSDMDVTDPSQIERYASQTRVLVVTTGAAGCVVYTAGQRRDFPVRTAEEVDPTGAGDIFATAFFTHLHGTGNVEESARFANCIAASSVTRVGLASTPTRHEVDHCRQMLRGD